MNQAGIAPGPWLAIGMSLLALISLGLFAWNVKDINAKKMFGAPVENERLQRAG
jgi:hypothetical protein